MQTNDILLSSKAWEEDKKIRFNLDELNRSFHDAVPVLAATNWHITNVERGYAEIVMPLNVSSTNQFVSHQAALMLVAADYTGGTALATIFHGVSILGFHKIKKGDGCAYFWGARSQIQWLRPSIDDLICRATVDKKVWNRAYSRYKSGRKVLETVHIDMYNGEIKVAESDFTYWVADTDALRETASDMERIHPLQTHRLQSSAHLISGLRAIEHKKSISEKLFEDKNSEIAAGKQGILLAKRFEIRSPELQPMVAARTKNLDDLVERFEKLGSPYNIVSVGAGLDFRRWRLRIENCVSYTEFDLPSLQNEKIEFLKENHLTVNSSDHFVSLDLLKDDIQSTVISLDWFYTKIPSIIWWEGGSMYFDERTSRKILSSIGKLLVHRDSCVWFDYVAESLIKDDPGRSSVEAFNDTMQKMGEPFINGYDNIEEVLPNMNLAVVEVADTGSILSDPKPRYELYKFCTARYAQRVNSKC
jgi:O-methyltransferase involved in polyketide biosynthesis/acyl-coenzyme A thioesterase PaaI-like protein